MLAHRAANTELTWSKELRPQTSVDFDYTLDKHALLSAIGALDFAQLKGGAFLKIQMRAQIRLHFSAGRVHHCGGGVRC